MLKYFLSCGILNRKSKEMSQLVRMDLRLNIYCLTCKNFENVTNAAKTEFKNIHITVYKKLKNIVRKFQVFRELFD